MMVNRVNAGARLDRLSIGPFHTRLLSLIGMGLFFDSFDNTLSSGLLASVLRSGWSTLHLNSLFMSATFVGLTIGAALAGWMSDRFGRRFAYQFNLAIFGLMSLVSALAPSMPWLIGFRFVMGIGLGAEYIMGYALIIEFVPPAQRGRYLGIMGLIAGIGVFVPSILSAIVIPYLGWRPMVVIGGVGTLWVWWLRRHLPESPRWLERVGRATEAEVVMQIIEEQAGYEGPTLVTAVGKSNKDPQPVSIAVLFSKPVLRRTLLAVSATVMCLFGNYSLTAWMPTFFVSQGMSVAHSLFFNAAMMAGWIAGPLIAIFISDRIGRRWGIVLFGVLCAMLASAYPFVDTAFAIVLCGFLLVSAVSTFSNFALGGSAELFPTEYRFRGSGFSQMMGRLCLIASPFIVLYMFGRFGIAGVVLLIAAGYLAVALLMAIAGIETNGQSLEALEPNARTGSGKAMPQTVPSR